MSLRYRLVVEPSETLFRRWVWKVQAQQETPSPFRETVCGVRVGQSWKTIASGRAFSSDSAEMKAAHWWDRYKALREAEADMEAKHSMKRKVSDLG